MAAKLVRLSFFLSATSLFLLGCATTSKSEESQSQMTPAKAEKIMDRAEYHASRNFNR